MATYHVGDQFIFGESPVRYGQDFAIWRRQLPADVVFTLEKLTHKGQYAFLRAPGYGIAGNYGDGSIHIALTELDKCRVYLPKETHP